MEFHPISPDGRKCRQIGDELWSMEIKCFSLCSKEGQYDAWQIPFSQHSLALSFVCACSSCVAVLIFKVKFDRVDAAHRSFLGFDCQRGEDAALSIDIHVRGLHVASRLLLPSSCCRRRCNEQDKAFSCVQAILVTCGTYVACTFELGSN